MALSDRIRQSLAASGPLDDDEIAQRLNAVRQQVNATARRMEQRGVLRRYAGHAGKIVNELVSADSHPAVRDPATRSLENASVPRRLGKPDIVLVTCVKTKSAEPSAARDLYRSSLFLKERAYAEQLGVPWFILSAEHGLVAPDEWLAPYERYLPDTPRSFRKVWGQWVVERLKLLAGDLSDRTIEVHASAAYVESLRDPLLRTGAKIVEPLSGLSQGARLAWYDDQVLDSASVDSLPSVDDLVEQLVDEPSSLPLAHFIERGSEGLRVPGLYSWWADTSGAADLSDGLAHSVTPGLIYAGLAGATKWPSGVASSNTLWSRITSMHLGRRHSASTLRRSLGSVLAARFEWPSIDEAELTAWMLEHLSVIVVPYEDPDTLGHMESSVLARIDPPLNLQGMTTTPLRRELSRLRSVHAARR